jgi:predicted nucleotidyltransferase
MLKDKSLMNKIKKWIVKENIIDAVLFGSAVKGKDNPTDIDICLIVPEEKESLELVEKFKKVASDSFHVSMISGKDFINGNNTLVKTLISEGISVLKNAPLADVFSFENKTLFMYSLKGFKPTDRVKFHYALRGRRGTTGLIEDVGAELLSDGILSVPSAKEKIVTDVFKLWNVKFRAKHVLIG